jgi:hypothetical protein
MIALGENFREESARFSLPLPDHENEFLMIKLFLKSRPARSINEGHTTDR